MSIYRGIAPLAFIGTAGDFQICVLEHLRDRSRGSVHA